MAREHGVGRAASDLARDLGRDAAHVDRVEVAPGRQHARHAARRRARGTGRDEAPVERTQHVRELVRRAREARAHLALEEAQRLRGARAAGRGAPHHLRRAQLELLDQVGRVARTGRTHALGGIGTQLFVVEAQVLGDRCGQPAHAGLVDAHERREQVDRALTLG